MHRYGRLPILATLIIHLFIISCKSNNDEVDQDRFVDDGAVEDSVEVENTMAVSEVDKKEIISFGSVKFEVVPANEDSLFQRDLTYSFQNKTDESLALNQNRNVVRMGDSLVFTLANEERVIIENYQPEGEETFSNTSLNYTYLGTKNNFSEVLVVAYESNWFEVLNHLSGERKLTQGVSFFSPDGKYVLTANADIEARYSFNGFELFEITGNNLIKVGEHEIKDWGPESVKWLSNDEILVTASRINDEAEIGDRALIYSSIKLQRIK